jgi:hypothetical protein
VRLRPSVRVVVQAAMNKTITWVSKKNLRTICILLKDMINQNPLPQGQGREDWRSNKPFPPPFHESVAELIGAGGLTC